MQAINLSKEITTLYKGVGILLIVLHNFFHNIPPVIGENEFYFNLPVTERFIHIIISSPTEWLRAFFSYFGHYGVQLFIFLSAYGLSKRHLHNPIQYTNFLKSRFVKIYFSFLVCIVVYIGLGLLKSTFLTDEKVLYWDSLLWKLLMVSNFVPGQAMMPVGPWWFLPFIFQFYLIYPLLLVIYQRTGPAFLIILSLLAIALEWSFNPYLIKHDLNLNYMPIGSLPLFLMGIHLASKAKVRIPMSVSFGALAFFVLGAFSGVAWLFSELCVVVLLLVSFDWYFKKLPDTGWIFRLVFFYGTVSFHLFMVNGFLRTPFHLLAISLDTWWFTILCGLFSLLFSTVFALVLKILDEKIRRLISNFWRSTAKA